MQLAAADTIAAVAQAAAEVTCTIFGMTLVGTTETYGVLYQGQLPSSATTIYTVPGGTTAFLRNIALVNTDLIQTNPVQFFRGGTAAANSITTLTLPAGGSASYSEVNGKWVVKDSVGNEAFAFSIPDGSITDAKLASVATTTMRGRVSAGTGVIENLTPPQVRNNLEVIVPVPEVVRLFGHSYMQNNVGTYDQSARMDALLKSALKIQSSNWYNYARTSMRLTRDLTANMGGWPSILNHTRIRGTETTNRIGPYTGGQGMSIICAGINDIGGYTNTAQQKAAFVHAMRVFISRCRASTVKTPGDASIVFGAGFVSTTGQQNISSMGTLRRSTTTGGTNTYTITLPADYKGEQIGVCMIGKAGVTGGTTTFSGTSGWTGTLSTSNIKAAADASACAVMRRGTAPVTGATQTIIGTTTQIDAGGQNDFDSWWLEALSPPPVIVCNINRLTANGQANYAAWLAATANEAQRDADVVEWNLAISTLVSTEFDSMVQIADCDGALNKQVKYFSPAPAPSPEVHPNDLGAPRNTDAIITAINNLVPVGGEGQSPCFLPAVISRSGVSIGFCPPNWYRTPFTKISAVTYTAVAQDMFAVPFEITHGCTRYDTMGLEATAAATTGSIILLGVYQNDGLIPHRYYPGERILNEWSVAVGTGAGLKSSSIVLELDPGMYWLVAKWTVAPATVPVFRCMDGQGTPWMPNLATTGLVFSGVLDPCGYKWTAQGTGALPSIMPAAGVLTATCPYIGMRAALPA